MNKFYLTSGIPYVNSKPHIGHALEFIQTDVIARYHVLLGDEVLKLCGSDENALKNVQAAQNANLPVQEFINKNNKLFLDLTDRLNAPYDVWQRGSDQKHHYISSQHLWKKCQHDIYKKSYSGLYCTGCEAFYELTELNEKGECFEHPGKKLEEVSEENYFFKLSLYGDQLIDLIISNKFEIVPEFRKNEILSFLKNDLKDISISRSNLRAKNWGVPVPEDESQRIYVWFDALNIYQSGVGFGWDENKYNQWWPANLHVIGKGIIRFHAIYWPAFLLSAGLKLPKKLFVHEYFTVNGQKMSKTIGNVYDPTELLEKLTPILGQKLAADALRYYCLAKISPFNDGDFSEDKFYESYKSDLQNGLGNLVGRVAKLCENASYKFAKESKPKLLPPIRERLNEYKFNEALTIIWTVIQEANEKINHEEPWKLSGKELEESLQWQVETLIQISCDLQPFLPETAARISQQFKGEIKSAPPLFPRIQ